MTTTRETAGLTKGLRALEKLAALAPVDSISFARAVGLGLVETVELLETFEAHGYARRVPGGAYFVLTRLALTLIGDVTVVGRLVSHAIEPIVETGDRIGQVVALSIPRGPGLVCCAVSRCCTLTGMSPGLHRPWPGRSLDRREVAVPLWIDGVPVACLSIHYTSPLLPNQEEGFRRQLKQLSAQLLRDFARPSVPRPDVAWQSSAAAAFVSAMVH